MGRFLKIFMALLLPVLLMDNRGNAGDPASVPQTAVAPAAVMTSGEIVPADSSGDDYEYWNSLEILPPQMQFAEDGMSRLGARVRSQSSGHEDGFHMHRTVFFRGSRTVIVGKALAFFYVSGLLPSGFHSFGQYLISLGKIRC